MNVGQAFASLGRYDEAIDSCRTALVHGSVKETTEKRIRELEALKQQK